MTEEMNGGHVTDEELDALLADPAMWSEPSAGLQARVVAAVQQEALVPSKVVPIEGRRRRRMSAPLAALLGAAAASVLTLGVVRSLSSRPVKATASLVAPTTNPGATGTALMRETTSGWEIRLNTTGLKRLEKPFYYEAWVFGPKGDVSVGTFHTGVDVVLWAGVELDEYPELIVTIEREDNVAAATDERAMAGPIVFKQEH
jgi:Anti-sigma-K factor rskA